MASPSKGVPFPYIRGLSPTDQYQLEEDFAYLLRLIQPGLGIYDCIIDPTLPGNDPGDHKYVNLGGLLANETWASGRTLHVGVYQPDSAAIDDSLSSNGLSGKGNLALHGITGMTGVAGGWKWATLSVASGQTVIYHNLHLAPVVGCSGQNSAVQSGGVAIAYDCDFSSSITSFNSGGITGQVGYAWNCRFEGEINVAGSIGTQTTNTFYDCDLAALTVNTSIGVALMYGGRVGTVTMASSTGSMQVYAAIGGAVNVSSAGSAVIIENTGAQGGNVNVTATGVAVRVEGVFGEVVFSGTPTVSGRIFKGSVTNSSDPQTGFSFVGPGEFDVNFLTSSFGGRVNVRGNHVHGRVHASQHSGPGINFKSAAYCHVDCTVGGISTGPGLTAYSFDSTSHNNLLVLGGSGDFANYSVPGTDLGYLNRVITEFSDSYVTTLLTSGALTGPMGPPGEDGEDGTPGSVGDRGATGATGATGAPGATGAAGAQGAQGIPGPPGDDGLDGVDGLQGQKGDKGDKGDTGVQGPPGLDGEDGLDGLPGNTGNTGAKGDTGATGPSGTLGAQGPQGVPGPPGMDGDDGVDGEPGMNGIGVLPGVIAMYGGAAAPGGWLLCQGQSLLRADPAYAALFGVIGTTYGTADGTHFTLPDLQEKFPLGKGGTHALGATGGATTHSHGVGSLTVGTHTHTLPSLTVDAHTHSGTSTAGGLVTADHLHASNSYAAGDHSHALANTSWAKWFFTIANPSVGKHLRATPVTAWTDVHEASNLGAGSATGGSNTIATAIGGVTAVDGGVTITGSSGAADRTLWVTGASSTQSVSTITGSGGTTSGPGGTTTVGGTLDNATGPIDPFVTVNYIIKL